MAGAVNVYNPSTGKRWAPWGWGYVSATPSTPTPVTPVATPTTPVVTPSTVTPPQQSVQLPFSKDTATYKALVWKGYTDQMIVDAYQKAKTAQPANVQASMTKQEQAPVIKPTVIKPTPVVKVPEKTPQQIQQEANVIRYSDNSEARMAEITNNLNQMAATNPNALKDVASFRGAYSYNQRSPEQQAVLSNRYTWYKKGIDLWLKPTQDIVDGFNNSTISSTDLESLKLTNPTKYADVQTGIEGKKAFNNFKDMLYGKEETTTVLADTTVDTTDTSSNLFDEYKAAISSPEVTGLQSSMADQEGKITQLNLELTKIQNDVEKTYEWSGASTSKIAAIVADQQQDIQNQISKLSIDQNTSINKYNSIVWTAKDLMTMWLQEKSAEQADRQAKMNELGFFYQSTPEGISQMATMKYNAENPDLDSTNPVTQKMALNQALDGYYKEYSDIIQRPKAQAVTDILSYAKSKGISVSQALKDNFVSPLQNKAEFKSKVANDYSMNVGWTSYTMDANGNFSTSETAITSSWVMNSVNIWNKIVQIDSQASTALNAAATELWNSVSVWEWFRTPEKYRQIVLANQAKWNEAHPNDKITGTDIETTRKALNSRWVAIASYEASTHTWGLAVDLYNSKWWALNAQQVAIMESHWFKQTAWAWDMGHRTYQGWWTIENTTTTELSDIDYAKFNNSTFKPQSIKDPQEKKQYEAYLAERKKIFNDPEASADDILRISMWWWDISDTSLQKMDKFNTVLNSLGDISKTIKKANTWPIVWIISSNNPYDTNAQALKSQLIAIIPNLARWVYGEVGVLTDNDVKLYQQTIPNLKQTADVQKAVLAMTLKTVQRGMENSLKTQARAGKDVSSFIWELKNIQGQVTAIETELWIWATTSTTQPTYQFTQPTVTTNIGNNYTVNWQTFTR